MEVLFFITYIVFVALNKHISKRLLNGFSLIFTPYSLIILFNNFFFTDFIEISKGSIFILLSGMLIYEMIFVLFYSFRPVKTDQSFVNYRIDNNVFLTDQINYFLVRLLIFIITVFRLLLVLIVYVRGGMLAVTQNDYSNLYLGPIGERIIILLYPLGWLLFNNIFNYKGSKKKMVDILLILFVVIVLLFSRVKAHAIVFLVGLYLVACVREKKSIILGGLLLVVFVSISFFLNYAIRWFAIDSSIPTFEYTFRHIWKYIAGGTINLDGTAFSGTTNYNFFDYWFQVLSPIPNEFATLVGSRLNAYSNSFFPYISSSPMPSVSYKFYEGSNVVNIFGFFYGSGGLNIFGFFINTVLYALFTEYSAFRILHPKNMPSFIFSIACLTYCFLSFFSLYFGTSAFWQISFYSFVVTWLFTKTANSSLVTKGNKLVL